MNRPTCRIGLGFSDWCELLREIEQLRDGGYVATGNWDLPYIAEHIAVSMQVVMAGKTLPRSAGATGWPTGPADNPAQWENPRRASCAAGSCALRETATGSVDWDHPGISKHSKDQSQCDIRFWGR